MADPPAPRLLLPSLPAAENLREALPALWTGLGRWPKLDLRLSGDLAELGALINRMDAPMRAWSQQIEATFGPAARALSTALAAGFGHREPPDGTTRFEDFSYATGPRGVTVARADPAKGRAGRLPIATEEDQAQLEYLILVFLRLEDPEKQDGRERRGITGPTALAVSLAAGISEPTIYRMLGRCSLSPGGPRMSWRRLGIEARRYRETKNFPLVFRRPRDK